MKKIVKIFLVACLGATNCCAQTIVKVKPDGKNDVTGVVFDKNYNPHGRFNFREPISRIDPSTSNLQLAESYLSGNKINVDYHLGEYYSADKLGKLLSTYKRQYWGYVNAQKDTIIIIQLLNFKERKKAEEYFEGWQHEYVIASGGFYDKNRMTFSINLSKKLVEFF